MQSPKRASWLGLALWACLEAWMGASQVASAQGAGVSAAASTTSSSAILSPDWVQIGSGGLDAAVSEDGQRWIIGRDGRAQRWNAASARWVPYGTRTDLARIDASREGAAAITRSGELLVTGNTPQGDWLPTGMRALDVGLGRGRIWLADALQADGSRGVMSAAFDATGRNFTWTSVPGRIERIDVDGEGRAWAVDAQGRLFVYANGQWIADANAPAAADVGVSANGTVLVVSRQADAGLGGGTLHARHPQTGAWSAVPGRATAISAEPDGRAFGVNSLNWVIGSTRPTITVAAAPEPKPDTPPAPASGEVRLADLAPAGLALPESLGDVLVKVRSGSPAATGTALIGDAFLNGVATRVIRYAPVANGPVNLLLAHRVLRVGDYMPDLASTGVRNFPFGDVIISFVPEANAEKKARTADATLIAKEPGLADFANFAPPAGNTLTGTLDFASIPNGTAVSGLMGLGTSKVVLTARNVDAALFKEVRESRTPVTPATPARTLKELADKYGTKLIEGLAFEAPVKALDGKQFGPAKLTSPSWLFALAQGEESIALSVGLAATMGMNVQAPAPDSMGQAAANRTPSASAIRSTPETLELSNVRVLFDPPKRSATLDGNITRAASSRVAGLKDFSLDTARFSGSLALADGQNSITSLTSLKTLELALSGAGRLPSQASTSGAKVDVEVKLALNDERNAVVPSVTTTASLTLADIVGTSVPGADRVKLTRVEWTPGTVAGNASLYGLPVRAVRHQGAGMAAPIVGLYHRELDLGSYIPAIRGTNIGSFGLANAVLYVLPEAAQPITYKTADEMPAVLAALLDRKGLDDIDPFPLTLRPGVNVIGLWGAKGEKEVDGGVAAKVKAIYGLEDKAFIAKGNFKVGALRNAKLENGPAEGGSGQGGAQGGSGQNNNQGGASGGSQGGSSPRDNAQSGSQSGSQGSSGTSSSSASGPRGNRTVSVSQVACAADSTLNVANRASGGNLDTAGLDLSFALPNFSPPYAAGRVRFSNVSFALKDVDGQLEPAVVGSMAINVARTVGDLNALARHTGAPATMQTGGVNQIGLAAKLRVRGDLNTLCNGVKPDSSYEIAFAGSTALNIADVGKHAFEALEKVTNLDPPEEPAEGSATPPATPSDPLAARVLELARKIADDMRRAAPPQKGWTPAFGLPFLEIRKFAAAGTFGQKDGKRTLTGTIWTDSKLGSETVDVLGSLSLESEAAGTEFKIVDWLLRAPGPIKLTGLPGVSAYANSPALPFIDISGLSVSRLELTPTLMKGRLASTVKDKTFVGQMVLLRQPQDGGGNNFDLFANVDRLAPNWILKDTAQLPGLAGSVVLGRTTFAMRTGVTAASGTIKLADLPKEVVQMYTATVGDLVTPGTMIPLVRGFSIAGRVTPAEMPDTAGTRPLKRLLGTFGLSGPLPVFGGLESAAASPRPGGFVEAWIPALTIPEVPHGQMQLANTRVGLSSVDGSTITANTELTYTPSQAIATSYLNGSDKPLKMQGSLSYSGNEAGDSTTVVSGTSNLLRWPQTINIAGITFGNTLGLDLEVATKGSNTTRQMMLTSGVNFRGTPAKARLGISADGSTGGGLLEVVARNPNGRLDLGSLLNPLAVLPAPLDKSISLSAYMQLTARGVLFAQEAGGRVTVAGEDVQGKLNGQDFAGQLAVVGISSATPALFLRSDTALSPAKVFPSFVPKGVFGNLRLPQGIVILKPDNANLNLSTVNQAVYDRVFAGVFGARNAARVISNGGLTVVSRLDLSTDVPAIFSRMTSWLPGSGDLVVAGGIESSGGATQLSFSADVQGLSLTIPSPIDNFVQSAGGNVQFFFRTSGSGGGLSEVGLSSGVKLRLPRLDTAALQEIDTVLSIAARAASTGDPSFAISANVPGTWADPLGLEGFSLTDTTVSIGQTTTGTTLAIATDRAQFQDSTGATKAFSLDLDTAWVPGPVPTQLAVQFKKSPDTNELVVGPILQAELMNSVLKLALKGGSALANTIRSRVSAAGVPAAPLAAFNSFADAVGGGAGGALSLLRSSPLAMIGVKNPEVFFVTPGDNLPPRPGIEQPPFGIGLVVKGDLIFDVGTPEKVQVASGVYKINLLDGYFVRGSITPPAPFNTMSFQLAGSQPLIGPAPQIRISGDFALPGGEVVPGVRPSLSGYFDFSRPGTLSVGADVSGRVRVGGFGMQRDFSMNVRQTGLTVYSAPSDCADAPVKLDGNISMSNILSATSLLAIARPDVSLDPVSCVKSLAAVAGMALDASIYVGNAALGLVTNDPITSAKNAVKLGKEAVNLAANNAQKLGGLAMQAAYLVINPSAAYQKLLGAFNDALAALESASKALVDLGCKVGISSACDERKRDRERERQRAEKRAFDAAVALRDEQTRQNEQKRETLNAASAARDDAEVAQRTLRSRILDSEKSLIANATILGGAATCADDQYWDNTLRRCWRTGEMMIAHTGGDVMKCLSPNKDQPFGTRLADGCDINFSDFYRWVPLPDGRLQGQLSPYRSYLGNTLMPQSHFCLDVGAHYDSLDFTSAPAGGKDAIGQGLSVVDRCNPGSSGTRFSMTASGEIMTPNGLCVMPKNNYPAGSTWIRNPGLYLRACNDPKYALPAGKKRWTMIASRDYGAEAQMPPTARILPASASSFCLGSSRTYNDGYATENCGNSDDMGQYFRFAMLNATQFMIVSRHSALCISAGSIDGQNAGVLGELCYGEPKQTFEMVGSPSGQVQFRNLQTGKCLALEGATSGGQPLTIAACSPGDAAQKFTLGAVPNPGKPFAKTPVLAGSTSPTRALEALRDSKMSFGRTERNLTIQTGAGAAIPMLTTGPTPAFVVQGSGGANVTISQQDILLAAPKVQGAGADLLSLRRIPHEPVNARGTYYDWHQYLKNVNGQLVWTYDWSADAVADNYATFRMVPGLTGTTNTVSFQSIVDATQYIVFRNGSLVMGNASDGAAAVFKFQ